MAAGTYSFGPFSLLPAERLLLRDSEPVELNTRYLDALALLVREQGRLVSKDRFLEEVWRGVPVTDEALTQCIRTLRRQLGDSASRPQFIETVPKHGYRFIAAVGEAGRQPVAARGNTQMPARERIRYLAAAGTLGGIGAGVIGGLAYGFASSVQPQAGEASALIVLLVITTLAAAVGAAGVALGIAGAWVVAAPCWYWSVCGGAAGGLITGAVVKLVGSDAFNLLLGHSPGNFTGAGEGALIGGAVGLAAWLSREHPVASVIGRRIALAGVIGALAGAVIPLLGGRLFAGSLDQLAREFPQSRIGIGNIGLVFGESGFGPIAQSLTGALECGLFAACVAGTMVWAWRGTGQAGA